MVNHNDDKEIQKQRYELLSRIEDIFETPLVILGFVWMGLLVIELLNRNTKTLETLGLVIWIIFILDFLLKFIVAPQKIKFLKKNIITIISLVVPAFRVFRLFRIFRLVRFSRGLRLVKVIGSLNRGMKVLEGTMKRRALGYVITFTIIVLFMGATGMYAFEKGTTDGFNGYGSALWWTAMILTTMGSEVWPQSIEGRILCIFLSLYAFAVFGYVTATLATFFIGKDANDVTSEIPGSHQLEEIRKEIYELKELLKNKIHDDKNKI